MPYSANIPIFGNNLIPVFGYFGSFIMNAHSFYNSISEPPGLGERKLNRQETNDISIGNK